MSELLTTLEPRLVWAATRSSFATIVLITFITAGFGIGCAIADAPSAAEAPDQGGSGLM